MLTFVGLGLYDERSITLAGRDAVRSADRVFAEFYTARLTGTTVDELEDALDASIEVRDRAGVERHPDPILDAAATGSVTFLTAGDPLVSTTHVDLRLRAAERGIETEIVHGTSAATAAAGLTGLQNYRFGAATTLPFANREPDTGDAATVPDGSRDTIRANRDRGLHTLVYLDIVAEREAYLAADRAARALNAAGVDDPGVAVARAGSDDPVVVADTLGALSERDFGPPLHLLVLPGELHHMEAEALRAFGDAPAALVGECVDE